MIYDNFGGVRDPLKQNIALQFCRNRNKDVSISTETHINLDQKHPTISEIIDWGPSFSLLEIVTQKNCLSCFIWVFKVSLRLPLIQKGGLYPLRFLPLMTEFSVFMPLQGIATGNSWLGSVSLEDYKII